MTQWQTFLGGGTVNPARSSYKEYTFNGSIQMDWPLEASLGNVMADCTAFITQNPAEIVMPDARHGSPGIVSDFSNDGLSNLTVKSKTGATIAVMLPGQTLRIILRSNSTESGLWRSFVMGAGAAQVQAAALASASIRADGAILVQAMPVMDISSAYAVGTAERGQLVNWVGGVNDLTLGAATELGDGWFFHLRNSGDGAITIKPLSPSKIDGGNETVFNPGQSGIITCDGDNFFTLLRNSTTPGSGGGGGEGASFTYASIDIAGSGDYVLSMEELNNTVFRFTGLLTGNKRVIVPPSLKQYWIKNETTGSFTLQITTQNAIDGGRLGMFVARGGSKIAYCNGRDVIDAANGNLSIPIAISEGGTGGTTASAARSNLGASSIGNSVFTAETQAIARSAINALAATDPTVTGSMAFTDNKGGVALSNGGKLYDDIGTGTDQSTVLRVASPKRLKVKSSDGVQTFLDINGANGVAQFMGGNILVSGGTNPNVTADGYGMIAQPNRQKMREHLYADVWSHRRISHYGNALFTAPANAITNTKTQNAYKVGNFAFDWQPPTRGVLIFWGAALMSWFPADNSVGGASWQLEVLMANGTWQPVGMTGVHYTNGSAREHVYAHGMINLEGVAAGCPMRAGFSTYAGGNTSGPVYDAQFHSVWVMGFTMESVQL